MQNTRRQTHVDKQEDVWTDVHLLDSLCLGCGARVAVQKPAGRLHVGLRQAGLDHVDDDTVRDELAGVHEFLQDAHCVS
eukprot:360935-Chlamydomonas_euryale.AAC.4